MQVISAGFQVSRSEAKSGFEYEDLIGRPFAYGGRPGSSHSLDCYGLVVECAHRMGVALPERQFSENRNIIALLMSAQMSQWQRIENRPGAIVLFKVKGVLQHVGVAIDEFRFIHTWEKSGGVCVERLEDWEKRIEGYYEYAG